jgi:hypothetical protein
MIKRIFFASSFIALLFSGESTIVNSKPIPQVSDTIVMLNRKKIPAQVNNISSTKIYCQTSTGENTEIERKQVEKIIYNNGRVDVFNKPVFEQISSTNWQAVIVTEHQSDVEGMYKCGLVSASASPSSRNMTAAKKSTIIKLQKKAANLGGVVVLVTHAESKGGYGDNPGYDMEGIVYGYEAVSDSMTNRKL